MNKHFLINGVSGGLGFALSKTILEANHRVCGLSRSLDHRFAEILTNKNFQYNALNKYSESEYQRVLDYKNPILSDFTHLILNGGSALGLRDPLDISSMTQVFSTNLFEHLELVKLAVEKFPKLECICFVASISGRESQGHPLYSAAKAATLAYSRSLGRFLSGRGISVFSIAPGAFISESGYWSEIQDEHPEKFSRFVNERLSVPSMQTAEDVAKFLYVLAMNHSVNMAGSNYLLDGGQGRSW